MTVKSQGKPAKTVSPKAWAKRVLGYEFKDAALLNEALTHASASIKPDYERLEFIGDRVLGLAAAEQLFETFKEADEGELGRRHAALVKGQMLAVIADAWDVESVVRLGSGQGLKAGGGVAPNILADVVESLLGAIYLDGGWRAARTLVRRELKGRLAGAEGFDPKTQLQEWLQSHKMPLPVYTVVEAVGPDHARQFVVRVTCKAGEAVGSGPSKQSAGMAAAGELMKLLAKDTKNG